MIRVKTLRKIDFKGVSLAGGIEVDLDEALANRLIHDGNAVPVKAGEAKKNDAVADETVVEDAAAEKPVKSKKGKGK